MANEYAAYQPAPDALPANVADGVLKRNAGNTAWEQVAAGGGAPGGVTDGAASAGTTGLVFGNHTHQLTEAVVRAVLATLAADPSFNSRKLTSVADPTAAQDAATKAYVDAALDLITGTVQTTDATQATVASHSPANDTAVIVEASIVGRKSDGTVAAAYKLYSAFRKDGAGVITQIGLVAVVATLEDAGAVTWDVTMDGAAGAARVRVTGQAATTIDWACRASVLPQTGA